MKAVLFDFGGTIDTDGVHWSEKFREYYDRFSIPVTRKDFERAYVGAEQKLAQDTAMGESSFYETLRRQLSAQFSLLGLREKDPRLQSMLDACYADVNGVIGRAKPLIRDLSARFRLGLVSNFYGNLETVCREFHLDAYFSAVIDSVVVGLRKPDPAIWALGLKSLSARPAEASVIGDSYERDITPAKALGCTTLWLRGRSWKSPSSTPAADYTIAKLDDAKSILLPASG